MRIVVALLLLAAGFSFSLPREVCGNLIRLLDTCAVATYQGLTCTEARDAALAGAARSGTLQTARVVADMCFQVCSFPVSYSQAREVIFVSCLEAW